MVRVQVQLEPARHRELKRRARELGVSVAELVRRAIEGDLQARAVDAGLDRRRRALAVVGKHRDPHGSSRMAQDHDAALARAYRS